MVYLVDTTLWLLLVASTTLISASPPNRHAVRDDHPHVDAAKHKEVLQAAGLLNDTKLTLTPWPAPGFKSYFPDSTANYLTFTNLGPSGSNYESLSLISLLHSITTRIASTAYPNPNFDVLGYIPDLDEIALSSFSFNIDYTIPSQTAYGREATLAVLKTLTRNVVEHGIKDLRATITIGDLVVGDVGVFTVEKPPPIDRDVQPIFLSIGENEGPVIEIGEITGTWPKPQENAVFRALDRASNELYARDPTESFGVINTYADVEGDNRLEARFSMQAWGVGTEAFLNSAAAAVIPALESFLTDLGEGGGMTFEIFVGEGGYRGIVFGEVTVAVKRRQGGVGMGETV